VVNLQSRWVMSCSFSNSGSWISSGGLDNICSLHRVDKGKIGPTQVELHGHTGFISSSHLLSNDSRVITSSGDGTCKLWDIETKRVIRDFDNGHVGSVEALVLSKDGTFYINIFASLLSFFFFYRKNFFVLRYRRDCSVVGSEL
jgi:WD40 repeat protein